MAKRTSNEDISTYASRRSLALLNNRTSYEPIMADLRDYITPEIGQSLNTDSASQQDNHGQRHDQKILNSLPTEAAMTLASGMQAGITSPSSPWFRLSVPFDWMQFAPGVRQWLDYVQDAIRRVIAGSNMYEIFHSSYIHMGVFGISCAVLVEDDETVVHGKILDQGSYAIGVNKRGEVDTVYRTFSWTVRQIAEEFGVDKLPEQLQEKLQSSSKGNRDDDTYYNIHCLIEPNSNALELPETMGKPFRSIYWMDGSYKNSKGSGILAIRHYSGNPIFCPRWATSPGVGVYGYGPGRMCIGDCMQLQEMEKDKLKAVRKVVDPPMAVPDSLKGTVLNTFPGGITYFSSVGLSAGKPAISPLYEISPDLRALAETIRITENRIKTMFYYDLFKMFSDMEYKTPPTAEEIIEKKQEKLVNLGPVVESMSSDLNKVLNRIFQIMWDRGIIPAPPEELIQNATSDSMNLKIEYISPLATAQRIIGLQSLQQYSNYIGQLAQLKPDVLDKFDADAIADHAAESLGIPANVRPDKKVIDKIRADRAKQMKQQQASEQMMAMSRSAKDLGQASTAPGTGLGDLRTQLMGGQP